MSTIRLVLTKKKHVYLFFYQYKHDVDRTWFPEFLFNKDDHRIYGVEWYEACDGEVVFYNSVIALRF